MFTDIVSDKKGKIIEFMHMLEYISSVSSLIGDDKALEILKNNIVDRRVKWYEKNKDKLELTGNPVEDAYNIITERLRIVDNAEIYIKGEKTISFKTTETCPVHEACKLLGLDHKRFCKAICEASANDFLSRINPNLSFSIEHKKDGDKEITVETIELKQ